jgi:hypothetical protein
MNCSKQMNMVSPVVRTILVLDSSRIITKRKFKQGWWAIPSTQTQRTTNKHISPQNTEYTKWPPHMICPGLGQAQKCDGVKPVYATPTLPSWYLDLQRKYMYKQTINIILPRFTSTHKDLIASLKWMKWQGIVQ